MDFIIDDFSGDLECLNNSYPCVVEIFDHTFKCAEAAFQASKCLERASEFENLNAEEAKKLGSTIKTSEEWETNKVETMFKILFCKFLGCTGYDMGVALANTEWNDLVYKSEDGDTFWGVCDGKGENYLGKLLMAIRTDVISLLKEEGAMLAGSLLDDYC